jgi:uncharacterized membrane protein (DUF485 family)
MSRRHMIYFYLIPGAITLYIVVIMFGTTEKFQKKFLRNSTVKHSNKFGIFGVITEFAAIAFILTPLWLLSTRNKFERINISAMARSRQIYHYDIDHNVSPDLERASNFGYRIHK